VMRLTGLSPAPKMKLDETDAIALALASLHQRISPTTLHRPRSVAAIRDLIRERSRV
jgi:hypothetical protein